MANSFAGLPIYVDEDAPLTRLRAIPGPEGVPWVTQLERVPVDYTLVTLEGMRGHVLVHPTKWPDFKEAMEMLSKRKAEAN